MKTVVLDKWSRLALYQEKLSDGVVRCHLCPHNCNIAVDKYGICNARANFEGELYTLTYGNACSMNIDPIEKKPLYHFFPGSQIYSIATVGCNLRCLNCQNWDISQSSPQDTFHYNLMPNEVIQQAQNHKINLIAFTYTEPTVFYEYMLDTAKLAHEKGLKTVMVTNGYINEKPLQKLCNYIDAVNIDLKCFDDLVYRQLTSGRLQPVLDNLKVLKINHVWLEITNLLVTSFTDSPEMIRKMCQWLYENGFGDTPIHFSSFFPNYKLSHLDPTSE
jgi:pyruvate formate lyase activating enzyme